MCTQVHFLLPEGADVAAADALVARHKVGQGLDRPGRDAPAFVHGEQPYLVMPWSQCHCGWGPEHFRGAIDDVLAERAAPWVGILLAEQGERHDGSRTWMTQDEFARAELDEDVLCVVQPPPRPPAVRRHGPRRRSKRSH